MEAKVYKTELDGKSIVQLCSVASLLLMLIFETVIV